jgi:predicted flap endonuclease-1-like 5' DNA nuclease
MFYDLASFPWWLLAVALTGVIVGWVTYADTPRRGWFEGWVIWGAVAFVVGLVVAVLKLLPGEAGLWLEIALLVLFLYVLGCFFGGWLKSMRLKPALPRAEQAAQTDEATKASSKVETDGLAEQQDQLASEEAAKAEAERRAAEAQAEQDRLTAEAAAKAEAERRAAAAQAEQERLTAEAAAKAEAERHAAAAQAEQDRLAAEAVAKAEAERRAAAAQAEQERLTVEAAAKAEAERHAAEAQAEQDRLAAEAVAKAEAERRAAEAQAEQDRLAAEAAATAQAERRAAAEAQAEQDRSAAETAVEVEAERQVAAADGPGIRPLVLEAPHGVADDLKLIKGIGPNNERTLNGLGVYHFSQISDWSPDHASWIDHQMAFPGRIERESWIPQAKLLAAGLDTDHSAGVKSGIIAIDDGADAPMSEAEAQSLAAAMPVLISAVEGEDRHAGARPLGLAGPNGGIADDLKRIKGIGKQNEARLRGLGIWHFDQIAAWSAENVKWVGSYLAFAGRIERERWIAQAKDLADGRKTELARRVETGLVATSRDAASEGQGNTEEVESKSD